MQGAPSGDRYSRQILFSGIGEAGQARLQAASATIVGCGALGSVSAMLLARAGVGRLRIVDRDLVQESNLHRQILYTEKDLRSLKPKAVLARDRLLEANPDVQIDALVADLNPDNAESLLTGTDLILDGTDNFETRYLINDVSVRHGVPWIYAACLGSYGVTMSILPGVTACLRCLMEAPPAPGAVPTCDTAGIIAPIAAAIASVQAAAALKFLAGNEEALSGVLWSLDVWTQSVTRVEVPRGGGQRRCRTCDGLELEYLSGRGTRPTVLCGRDAVQITPMPGGRVDLSDLEGRLRAVGRVERSPFLLRLTTENCVLTVFEDGRAIVAGTTDAAKARALYSRYIGW